MPGSQTATVPGSQTAPRAALPGQSEAGNAAALAQVTVDANREYALNDQMHERVHDRAGSLQSEAASEATRMREAANLHPGDPGYDPNRTVEIHEENGHQILVEIVRDATGHPVSQTRIETSEEPWPETSIERVQADPGHPGQFVHSYQMTYEDGGQTVVREDSTLYEGQPEALPGANEFDSFGPAYQGRHVPLGTNSLEMVERDGFVSEHTRQTSYDPATGRETSTEREATFEETTLDAAGLPAGTDRAFDRNGPIVQGTVRETTTNGNGESATTETQVTAQDNIRVTSTRNDWGPSVVTIERQTDDHTKLTQTLMEGSTESAVTQTTVDGNTVQERTRMLDQAQGGDPTLTGAVDTTSVYGEDGAVADRTRTTYTSDGNRSTEHTSRTVVGDQITYDTTVNSQQGGGPVTTSHNTQVNRRDENGNEIFQRSDVTLADGKQATISEADGQTRSVTITPPGGGPPQTGRVEQAADGSRRVVFTDPTGARQEVVFTADGRLAEGSSFGSLTPEQQSMLPLLMLGAHGFGSNLQGDAAGNLVDTMGSGGISGEANADVLGALAAQEANTVELAQHDEQSAPLVQALQRFWTWPGRANNLMSRVGQLGGEDLATRLPWWKGVGGALGMVGGGISMISGADALLNPQDRWSRHEGALELLGGGGAVVGGAAALGLMATPPGWLLGAIGGTAMLGQMIINHKRDHGYAGMMSELIPGESAMSPELWNAYDPVTP